MRLVTVFILCSIVFTCTGTHAVPAGKTPQVIIRKDTSMPGGLSFKRGELTPAEVQKLKSNPDVAAVIPDKPIEVPPTPGPHMNWEGLLRPGTSPLTFNPIKPTTWLAKELHGCTTAWSAGYRGAGVKVAVLDEGVDFAHPDLEGTQARVTNPESPYYGWPISFDPGAMYYYASTGRFTSGYVSTAFTISGSTGVYRGRTYKLTGTSKSGIYHIGSHPSYWLPFIIDPWGLQPAVLVADEVEPGVYDTVYVDINKNLDFRDDKACRKGDEASWWDANGDGLADYSGGMVYFIADGKNPIPASDWLYGLPAPANGSMVAFAGSFGKYDSHGTLVSSAITAQGKVGRTYELPQKPAGSGMVYGMAPEAKVITVGSIYNSYADLYDAVLFAVNGYDGQPGTGDEADIVNMSFGISSEDADGWDFLSRYITYLNETTCPRTTFVASSGNGGPGYGTVSSPGGAASAITVGASTMYGSTDLISPITGADQILSGDVQNWSDRGPNSLGMVKPDVTAIGAWATGATPIYGSGEYSWAVWAGTSLSAPITSGVVALIYDAYRSRHGVFPTHKEAREILMSGCRDQKYNVFEQGAGFIDAARSTAIAAGSGGFVVSPSSWTVGRSQKKDAPAFPVVMKPGESATGDFTITNTGTKAASYTLSGKRLVCTGSTYFHIETSNAGEDEEALLTKPDYLADLTHAVPDDTDLLRIRVTYPYDKFSLVDPSSRFLKPSNLWIVSLNDWTDVDGSGDVWTDTNGNGIVNDGEFQESEVNQFMFTNPWSDVIEVSVRTPGTRIHNGLLLGLHHSTKSLDIASTRLRIELEFYRQTSWNWFDVSSRQLNAAPGQALKVPVRLKVPADAGPGIYAGSLVVDDSSGNDAAVPVSAVVTGKGSFGSHPVVLDGGDGTGDTFDNGKLFGAFDWGWREESGDWRFYYVDVPQKRPNSSSFILANTRWSSHPADTDIMLYRPDASDYFSNVLPEVFGPYGLSLSGTSRRTHTLAGMWPVETSTGGPSEWVAGEATPGLNLIQMQNVLASGESGSDVIDLKAGEVWIEPKELNLASGQTSADIRFSSSFDLPGLSALTFGFALPQEMLNQPIRQEAVDTPSSAQWKREVTISDTGLLEIWTEGQEGIDLDLYLLYDSNADGYFDWDYEVVGVSGTPGASEHLRINLPKNGRYLIAAHGYRVPKPSTFDIRTLVAAGKDINASMPDGVVKHGQPRTIKVTFPPAHVGAQGMIFLGPPEAPGVIPIPVYVK